MEKSQLERLKKYFISVNILYNIKRSILFTLKDIKIACKESWIIYKSKNI